VLLSFVPLPADEISRLRGWACFATVIALLYHRPALATWLLLLALVLDSADGAVARKHGKHSPQTDRAMDMYTEFMLYAAYLTSYFGWVAITLMALWVIPKTVWLARHAKRRLLPDVSVRQFAGTGLLLSLATVLQGFVFTHLLLVLLAIQWAFNWTPP